MKKPRPFIEFTRQLVLAYRFNRYFTAAVGPCGSPLGYLYDRTNAIVVGPACGAIPNTARTWTADYLAKPKLAAIYDPARAVFDVISFTIDTVHAERLEISVYDIFELRGSGARYSIESHGVPYVLEIDRMSGDIGGDDLCLLIQGEETGAPVELVLDRMLLLLGVPRALDVAA